MVKVKEQDIITGLIINAPSAPSGFMPIMPKNVKEPVKPEFDLTKYSWKSYVLWVDELEKRKHLPCYTGEECDEFRKFYDLMNAYKKEKEAYDRQYQIQQLAQWPWFYANAVMEAAEVQGVEYV